MLLRTLTSQVRAGSGNDFIQSNTKWEDIESMQEQRIEGSKIIEKLVESSSSFSQKTKFSQEKFLKKKTKKYCQYLRVRRPSIRLLLQIRNRDITRMKTLNLRIDSLAQIINHCNVRSGGKYIIYDNASQGLVVATALERIIHQNSPQNSSHIFYWQSSNTMSGRNELLE
jgi:tRNA (adenine-N(1)-)-methyltransferase non-catalytic subunit